MIRFTYSLVAILDLIVIVAFYGAGITGISLRSIPEFDDQLPIAAFLLLCVSALLLLLLMLRSVRMRVLATGAMWLPVVAIAAYFAVAVTAFASVYMGQI